MSERFIEKSTGIISSSDNEALERAKRDNDFVPLDMGGLGLPGRLVNHKKQQKENIEEHIPAGKTQSESDYALTKEESEELFESIANFLNDEKEH